MDLRDLHPVILAGGLGTRLRHVLADLPKPMAPVSGRPFVEWVIRYLRGQGCDRASLSIGFRAEAIEDFLCTQPVPGIRLDCVKEPEPRGTAGGFLHTARHILAHGNPPPAAWLVLNGDSLLLADLASAVSVAQRQSNPVAIMARHVADANRYGRLDISDSDRLTRFSEKTSESNPGWINAGVYLIRHDMLERFPAQAVLSFEYDVFPCWLREDRPISVVRSAAPFLDIGTESSLAQAADFIENNIAFFPG